MRERILNLQAKQGWTDATLLSILIDAIEDANCDQVLLSLQEQADAEGSPE